MRTLLRSSVVLIGSFAPFAACSGGGASGDVHIRCHDGSLFCLVSCDLGCGLAGCAITEIAENQRLRFVFNQPIAQNSVNGSSFSIRTSSGVAPEGDLRVDGNMIEFVPSIRVTNGVGTFGFQRNQSYMISIQGGPVPGQAVHSVAGDRLGRDFHCTVTATRGILDEDNAPPSATLIAPTNLQAAPLDATIVLRFSEVIDTTPFLVPLGPGTPIQYLLRRSRLDPVTNERDCDPSGSPISLDGFPRASLEQVNGRNVTVVSMKPTLALPGLSCVEVLVTGEVRDLSGRGAVPSRHVFFTEGGSISDQTIVETFTNDGRRDGAVSGGAWQNGARPALLGGDGRHGSFDATAGMPAGPSVYEWNTESQDIPAHLTRSGVIENVNDGRFFFSDFTLPAGVTVRFVGANPAQVFVRGRAEIMGRLELNGGDLSTFRAKITGSTAAIPGQEGSRAGAGGGRGGRGGDRCLGTGPTGQENGQNGEDVQVDGQHAYAGQTANTGGRGSALHPSHGVTSMLVYTIGLVFNGQLNAGGSGGGYNGPGGQGTTQTPTPPGLLPGVTTTGGNAFNLFPLPAGHSSLVHFLVGGSGGGGAGSHPYAAITGQADAWIAGCGGTGGGGALAIRSGADMVVGTAAVLMARGGSGPLINADNPATPGLEQTTASGNWGVAAPGGAGSGGSILLQAGRDLTVQAAVDTSGGTGGFTANIQPSQVNFRSEGGAGATGFYRFEAGATVNVTSTGNVPAFDPARNQGPLDDRDMLTGSQSVYRGTGLVFPPTWLRYEMEVDLDDDGVVDRIYSDDPAVPNNSGPASDPTVPVRVLFQGARLNNTTNEPLENSEGPWRDFVREGAGPSLNIDSVTGFRFQLIHNRDSGFPNAVVKRLAVVVRG